LAEPTWEKVLHMSFNTKTTFNTILPPLSLGKKAAEKISGLVSKVLCFDVYQDNEWIKGSSVSTLKKVAN
jgi:hypothetical protein